MKPHQSHRPRNDAEIAADVAGALLHDLGRLGWGLTVACCKLLWAISTTLYLAIWPSEPKSRDKRPVRSQDSQGNRPPRSEVRRGQ